jgi:hypothetical protein
MANSKEREMEQLKCFQQQLDNWTEELIEVYLLQELTEWLYFTFMGKRAFNYYDPSANDRRWIWGDLAKLRTAIFLRKLWTYWVLLEPFESKLEIQLLKSEYFYNNDRKNMAKRVLQSPIVYIDYFKCREKEEVNKAVCFLKEEDNAATFAWFWHRVFDMTKVHENLTEFLYDVEISHKECLIDTHNPLVISKLIEMAREEYPIFQEIVNRLRYKSKLAIPDFYEQKRLIAYWIALLPMPVDVILTIKKLELTSTYLENLFFIIEDHWRFLNSLDQRYLNNYYNYLFFNRRRIKGISDIVLNTLPETEAPRIFKEFLIEIKRKYKIKN